MTSRETSMKYEARPVVDDAEVVELAAMVERTYAPAMESDAPVTCYPKLEVLRGAPHLYAAYYEGRPVAVAVISDRGQGGWFNSHPDHVAEAGVAIMAAVHRDLGTFWGQVQTPDLCAAFVAASGGQLVADARMNVRWISSDPLPHIPGLS